MNKIKVALIGFGHLGKWHAQKVIALKEYAELVAIVEPFNTKAASEAYPNILVVKSVKEVMDKFAAAIIVTPTSLHFELAKELLLSDKHIFCEKPVTETYNESKELIKIAEKKNKVFAVGQSERCHQIFEEREKFADFLEGTVSIRIDRYAPFKGRATDVDVVSDLMIHDIDMMLYLMKRVPKSVHSIGFKMRTDKWDMVTSFFEFNDGSKAAITVGRNNTTEVRRFESANKNGVVEIDLFANKIRTAHASSKTPETFVNEESYPKRDHLLIEQEAFYKAISGNGKPLADLADGAKAVYLVDKVLEGLAQNKTVEL